jgi:hypothetical protein
LKVIYKVFDEHKLLQLCQVGVNLVE